MPFAFSRHCFCTAFVVAVFCVIAAAPLRAQSADSDGDGVPNYTESPGMFYSPGEANKIAAVTSALSSTNSFALLMDGDSATSTFKFNAGQAMPGAEIFKIEYPLAVPLTSVTVANSLSLGTGSTAKLQGSTNGSTWLELSTANVSLDTSSNKVFPVQQNAGAYKFYRIVGVATATTLANAIAEITSVIDAANYNASLNPKPAGGKINDLDGDGTANHLDTDSDGDGATDADESGADGSTYASLALNAEVNATLDFDEDGTPDYLDSDMDGDGLSNWFEGYVPNEGPRALGQYKRRLMKASFHSAFYRARDGGYYVAGQDIVADGTSDYLFPRKLSPQNGYNFTGDVIDVEAAGDQQHLLLTTDGLWAWGFVGQALPSALASAASFRKVTLPAEIDPAKVAMMNASGTIGGATALLMQDGTLWMAVADAGDASMHGAGLTSVPSQFRRVMIDANTPLTGVTDVVISRASGGFAYSASADTFYTWGPNTYLGDGSAAAKRSYATPMANPLPPGVKMVQIMTSFGTYLVLGSDGRVYSMGHNPGNGSTTPVLSWTTVRNEAGTSTLEDVAFINGASSYNESAFSLILENGRLLSWGGDGASMLGIAAGKVFYLPTHPLGAVVGREVYTVENGGHFTPVLFADCDGTVANTGHNPGGAFGDGTTTDRAQYTALMFLGDLAYFCNTGVDANGFSAWLSTDSDSDGCSDMAEAGLGGRLYKLRALGSEVNSCLNSDSDTINDVDDIDDDNDGVPDHVESSGCFYTATELTGPAKADFAIITSELAMDKEYFRGLTDGIGGSEDAVRVAGQAQAGKEIFRIDLMRPTQLDAIYIQKASSIQIQGGNVMFQGSNDGMTWTNLWAAAANPSNSTEVTASGLSLTNANKFAVQQNAAPYRFYRILGVATANTGAAWVSEFYFDINPTAFSPSLYPKSSCVNDLDGDGNANHLDTDSDGDACSDAYESGASSDKSTVTFSAPYGTNGLADSVETAADSGAVNYSSIYGLMAASELRSECADTDGDGLADYRDADGDNDGVPNVTEAPACFFTPNEWNTADKSSFVLISSDLAANPSVNNFAALANGIGGTNGAVQFASNQNPLNKSYLTFTFVNPVRLDALYLGKTNSTQINGAGLILQGANSLTNWVNLMPAATNVANATTATTTNGAVVISNANRYAVSTNAAAYRYYRLYSTNTNAPTTGTLSEIYFDVNTNSYVTSLFAKTDCATDTDNDGTINYLDLDSDNDGFGDAFEGGASTNQSAAFAFPTNSVNINGVPTAVQTNANGDAVTYVSIYDFYALQPGENPGSDTDGDGILNPVDLDDDNDGIPDTQEGTGDSDGDGIPNRLELDSDNDGCFDAREGGAVTAGSQSSYDPVTGKFTGPFGTNGLNDAVETTTDSGAINYSSTYITYAISDAVDTCSDTDGDGIPDHLDPDADGDCVSNWAEGYMPISDPRSLAQFKSRLMRASFHSAFYQAGDGGYFVAGDFINPAGTGAIAVPLKLSPENGYTFTGEIIDVAAVGSQEHVLLTTEGMWVWGSPDQVLSNVLTGARNDFRKVNLPAGLNPANVASMTATRGGTALLMKDGTVWVAVVSATAFSNSAQGAISLLGAGPITRPANFVPVMLNATTPLSGITDMIITASGGFAYSALNNTFYTWGPATYLGDGTAKAERSYATPMVNPLPAGVTPVQIVVNVSTYLILGSDGRVYSLGDWPGIGGTTAATASTTWTFVRNETNTGPIEGVTYIDGASQYNTPAFSMLVDTPTLKGRLLSWGQDNMSMMGIGGGTYYLPKRPLGDVEREIFAVENGGHFTPILYGDCVGAIGNTGHNPGGAFGDGSTTDRTSYAALVFLGDLVSTCSPDADGDGIPNYLDEDSDGDGCSDFVESGGCPGYNYERYALTPDIDLCLDSDGDGIADFNDIDDDNDGLPDHVESPACFSTTTELDTTAKPQFVNITSQLNTQYSHFAGLTDSRTNMAVSFASAQNPSGKEIFRFDVMRPTRLDAIYLQKTGTNSVLLGSVMLQGSTNGTNWTDLWTAAAIPSNVASTNTASAQTVVNANVFTIQTNADAYRHYRILGVATNNLGTSPGVSEFFFDVNTATFNPSLYPKASCFSDADGDTDANHLDADSDNDGCYDAIEGGAVTSTTQSAYNATNGTFAGAYGSNGLTDVAETAVDSGAINYESSSYSFFAVNADRESCTDTDGDGIPDFRDADADNDGVLNFTETPACFFTANEWNTADKSSLMLITSDLAATNGFTNFTALANGLGGTNGTVQFATNQTTRNKSFLTFQFVNPVRLDALYLGKTSATQITATNLILQGANDPTNWVNLMPSGLTVANATNVTTTNGAVVISNANRYPVSTNAAAYRYYRLYSTNFSSPSAGTLSEIYFDVNTNSYVTSLFAKPTCGEDTDGDGSVNYLDLDSDGDGTSDAYESGATTNRATNYAFPTNAVNEFGVPSAVQTDANSDTVTYNSTYDLYALNPTENLTLDSDGDGIPDVFDLDDDNDGVPDAVEDCRLAATGLNSQVLIVDESGSIDETEAVSVRTALNNWASSLVGSGKTASIIGMSPADNNARTDHVLNVYFPPGGTRVPAEVMSWINAYRGGRTTIQADYWASGLQVANTLAYEPNSVVFIITDGSQGTKTLAATRAAELETKVGQIFTIGVDQGTYWGSVVNVNSAVSGVYDNVPNSANNAIQEVTDYDVDFGTSEYDRVADFTTLNTALTKASQVAGALPKPVCDFDTDGDGIPNSLDPDSDGDGCSDALEAGATTDTAPEFQFTGAVGSNGLADSVETSADSGAINYDSTYNFFALQPGRAACDDTDGDGIPDYRDADADNDGVLNFTEAPSCFFTANEWNTTNKADMVLVSSDLNAAGGFTNFTALANGIGGTNGAVQFATNQSALNKSYLTFQFVNPVRLDALYLGKTNSTQINGGGLILQGANSLTNWVDLMPAATNVANATAATTTNGAVVISNANRYAVSTNAAAYRYYRLYSTNINAPTTGTLSEVYFDVNTNSYVSSFFAKTDCATDTDNDGLVNYLDLDSDDDGCFDAVEAGAVGLAGSPFYTALTGTFNGPYGSNGLDNSVETTADSSTINYTSTYTAATNPAVANCVPPPLPPTVNPLFTNSGTPTVTGTVKLRPGQSLTVIVNGVTYTTANGLVIGGENWSLPLPQTPVGTYAVTATVTAADGSTASDVSADELVIDTTPPLAPAVVAQTTKDTTPTVTGTATLGEGETLAVAINGTTYTTANGLSVDPVAGTWSVTLPTTPEGTYPVTATVTDAAGNATSDATTNELIIDLTPPPAPTVTAQTTGDLTPVITGTAEVAPGDTLTVTVNGATYTVVPDGEGNWSVDTGTATPTSGTLGTFVDGQSYPVTATVTDAAGNATSDTTTNELTISGSLPVTPTVVSQVTNNTTPTVTGTAVLAEGQTLSVTINGTTYTTANGLSVSGGTWSVTLPTTFEGTYPVTATISAPGGVTVSDTTTNELIIDTTAPAVPTVASQLTNDTTPTVTGTVTLGEGETLTVTIDGTTYTTANGLIIDGTTWSVTLPTTADGTYPVTATVTDAAGNSTTDTTSNELVIETVAPATPTVVPQNTNDTTPTVTGTATLGEGETLAVTINGTTYTTANGLSVDPVAGTWSVTLPTTPEGTYPVTATVTDAAGNTSTDTTTDELVIDTTAPAAPTVVSQTTNESTPTVTGTVTLGAGETLAVTIDGVTYTTANGLTINGTTWSVTLPTTPDGTYPVTATVTDAAGNSTSDTTTGELIIETDVPAPTITVNNVTADNILNATEAGQTIAITGTTTGTKAGDTVTLTINGKTFTGTVAADLTYSIEVPGADLAADTSIDASVSTTNDAGSTGTGTANKPYAVDTEVPAPTIAIDDVTADNILNAVEARGSVNITGTTTGTKEGDTVTLTINGKTFTGTVAADLSYSIAVPGSDLAADPDKTIDGSVSTTDDADNTGTATDTQPYSVDTQAPALTVTSVGEDTGASSTDKTTKDNTLTITGTTEPGAEVEIFANGTSIGTVSAGPDGAYTLTTAPLADGPYGFTVTATDAAGNTTEPVAVDTWMVDTSVTITITNIAGDDVTGADTSGLYDADERAAGPVVISGTTDAEPGQTVVLTINGKNYSTTVEPDGTWEVTLTAPDSQALNHGSTYAITASVSDLAGNTAVSAGEVTLEVLIATPDVPTVVNQTTSSKTPVIIGSAQKVIGGTDYVPLEDGDTLAITVNGVTVTATIDSDQPSGTSLPGVTYDPVTRTWSLDTGTAAAFGLDDGIYDVTVVATSGADSETDISTGELVINSNPPTITIDPISTDDLINAAEKNQSVTFSGTTTAEVGATVTLTGPDGVSYTATVLAGLGEAPNYYAVTVPASVVATFTDGDKTLNASVTNEFGLTGTAERPYEVDTTAPAAPVITLAQDNVGPITDDVLDNGLTDDNLPVLVITAEPGVEVKVYSGGVLVGTATEDPENPGTYTLQLTAPLADGPHSFVAIATDAAGNTSPNSNLFDLTVDTTPPVVTVTIDSVTSDDIINLVESEGTVTITGATTGTKPGDTVTLEINEATYTGTVDADGNYSIVVNGADLAADVSVVAHVSSTDEAGNTGSASAERPYTVDTTAPTPTITIDDVTADNILNAAEAGQNINITGTTTGTKEGDTVTLTINGNNYTGTVAADLSYSIEVSGADLAADSDATIDAIVSTTDEAGNTGTATDTQPYTVDTEAPVPTITINDVTEDNTLNAAEAGGSVNITGTTTGTKEGDTVTLTINGNIYTGTVDADGNYSIEVPGSVLATAPDASVDASVTTTDEAGNTGTAETHKHYTVDTEAPTPTITINDVTADNILNATEVGETIAISGTTTGTKEGDTVTLTINGNTYTSTVAADLSYTIEVSGADLAADPDVTIDASVSTTDDAGNTGTATDTQLYTVDTTAPTSTITIDDVTADNILNAVEAGGSVTITGTTTGTKEGDTVTLTINGNTYTGTVAADLSYSIAVLGSDLAVDTSVDASVSTTNESGNTGTATATQPYTVDTEAPAPTITIDNVTEDNILNAAEAGGSVTITGTTTGTKEGDTVTLTINGNTYTGAVAADLSYSIAVPGADLAADPNQTIDGSVSTTDDAGNTGTATDTQTYNVDTTAPTPTITIDDVTADNIVNAAEAGQNINITGTTTGTKPGDTVTLTINGKTFTGTVAADLSYSISVPGSDLAADQDATIEGSVSTTDDAGNTGTAIDTQPYSIITIPPAIPTVVSQTTGDTTPTVAGTVDLHPGDTLSVTINGTTYTTANGLVINGSTWEVTLPTTPTGTYGVAAVVTDAAGNTSPDLTDNELIITGAPHAMPDFIAPLPDRPLKFLPSILLGNDTGDNLQLVTGTFPTTLGGTVTITDRAVIYTPPAGGLAPTDIDSFNYTVINGAGQDTGTVNLVAEERALQLPIKVISATDMEPGGKMVRLCALPMMQYEVFATSDLATGNGSVLPEDGLGAGWELVGVFTANGRGDIYVPDANAGSQRFYRLRIRP